MHISLYSNRDLARSMFNWYKDHNPLMKDIVSDYLVLVPKSPWMQAELIDEITSSFSSVYLSKLNGIDIFDSAKLTNATGYEVKIILQYKYEKLVKPCAPNLYIEFLYEIGPEILDRLFNLFDIPQKNCGFVLIYSLMGYILLNANNKTGIPYTAKLLKLSEAEIFIRPCKTLNLELIRVLINKLCDAYYDELLRRLNFTMKAQFRTILTEHYRVICRTLEFIACMRVNDETGDVELLAETNNIVNQRLEMFKINVQRMSKAKPQLYKDIVGIK